MLNFHIGNFHYLHEEQWLWGGVLKCKLSRAHFTSCTLTSLYSHYNMYTTLLSTSLRFVYNFILHYIVDWLRLPLWLKAQDKTKTCACIYAVLCLSLFFVCFCFFCFFCFLIYLFVCFCLFFVYFLCVFCLCVVLCLFNFVRFLFNCCLLFYVCLIVCFCSIFV